MRLLPFMDIPIVDSKAPSVSKRYADIVEWAEGDKAKLSASFLAYKNLGEYPEDYLFQIAFIENDCLVTNREVIESMASYCSNYKRLHREWEKESRLILGLRAHLELYYDKLDLIPPWGSNKYNKLLVKGRTVRILEGPHKGGGLKPNQKRKIILDNNNEIVYGPML